MVDTISKRELTAEDYASQSRCGACQVWGCNPIINEAGKCETCDRTNSQIQDAHGVVELDYKEMMFRQANPFGLGEKE